MTRVKIRTAATNSFLQVTSIYCLLGLALISMGISLASEQVYHFKKETIVIQLERRFDQLLFSGEGKARMVCLLHRHEGGRGSGDEVTISYFLRAFASFSYSYSYILVLYFWCFYVLLILVFIHVRLILLVPFASSQYSYSYLFVLYFWCFCVLFLLVFIHIRLMFLVLLRPVNTRIHTYSSYIFGAFASYSYSYSYIFVLYSWCIRVLIIPSQKQSLSLKK